MEDNRIVQLFWDRSEEAISRISDKYGAFCFAIAENILSCREDSEECVNDTWLSTWNAIPPARPDPLKPYVGKITRNIAFDKYAYRNAAKRNANATVLLSELGEIADGSEDTVADTEAITAAINEFLAGLDRLNRALFLRRYWYYDSLADLAGKSGLRENVIKARLARMREKLRRKLMERGIRI